MNGRQSVVAQRRNDLYGPGRCLVRDATKKKQLEDHIQQNFQKGVEKIQPNFQTTTAAHFKHGTADLPFQASLKGSFQRATHFLLGSDTQSPKSITKSDYTLTETSKMSKLSRPKDLGKINIADFNPQYMDDKRFGKSQYRSDFNRNELADDFKLSSNKEASRYNRSTHFELGSEQDSSASEMNTSFRGLGDFSSRRESFEPKEKGLSNVFREGDYNVTSQIPTISTHRKDFTAAGRSTVTKKAYSHVLPRQHPQSAVSNLRRLLIEKNKEEFKNPRDPTTINVVKAFAAYDNQKTGSVSVDDLVGMCKKLDITVDVQDIQNLLNECNCSGDGRLDFVKFCEYLTARSEPQKQGEDKDFTSTNTATYSIVRQGDDEPCDEDPDGGGTGVKFQTGTHFKLGYERDPSNSVYTKDFDGTRTYGMKKPPTATQLPCSKVMPEFPVVHGSASSVSRRDYSKPNVALKESDKFKALNEIKKKHGTDAIDFSNGRVYDDCRQPSVMASSYCTLQSDPVKIVVPTHEDYHHLESNRALPHPLPPPTGSEAQDNYTVPRKGTQEYVDYQREHKGERSARILDNKRTHFLFGSDPPQNLTENMAEFYEKECVDANSLAAAGRPDLPKKGYSVIAHDTGDSAGANGGPGDLQQVLQQRNYLRNINPRDTMHLNMRKAFLEYDKNLSGAISKEELKAVCKGMKVDASDSDLDEIIARCGSRGDGLIDYHEFALNLSRLQLPSSAVLNPFTSITQQDFQDPKDQQMSEEKRLISAKDAKRFEPVPIQPTELFQWDRTQKEDYIYSVQRKDFREPESVLSSM